MPNSTFNATLPNVAVIDQLAEDFKRNGYAVARQLIKPDEVRELCAVFDAAAADGPVPNLSDTPPKDPTIEASGIVDPLTRYPRMMNPHSHMDLSVGPISLRYLLDERFHVLLKAMMDDDIYAAQSMFYFKPPGARGQCLHQDNFYLRVKPGTCVAAWIALDDADEENGAMSVVPLTHNYEVKCPEPADTSVSFTSHFVAPPPGHEPKLVPLKAGDVMFFNGSVIHGSGPNRSKTRFRRSFITHYLPASSVELASWYKAISFDGRSVPMAQAEGGGPCGITVAAPH